ncbi:MAG: Protein 21 [Francisellaceae bacterium]|nr:Protein 21 [Francisellaceae bacterium]
MYDSNHNIIIQDVLTQALICNRKEQMSTEFQFIKALELSDISTIRRLVTEHPDLLDIQRDDNLLFITVEKAKENTKEEISFKKEVIDFLLQAKPNFLEYINKRGLNILMVAAQYGQNESIKVLLEKKFALLDKTSKDGTTVLMVAAQNGRNEIIKLLLEKDHNLINKSDNHGHSVLMAAAQAGHNETIKFLLEKKSSLLHKTTNDGITVLMVAAQNGQNETIKLLLEINSSLLYKCDNYGFTILMVAAHVGHNETIKLLLEINRTLLHKTANDGTTVLMVAAQNGQNEVIKLLLEKEPPLLYKRNNFGFSVLMAAAQAGQNETVKLLLKKNPDFLHETTTEGLNVVMVAAMEGHIETIKLLLLENDKSLLPETIDLLKTSLLKCVFSHKFKRMQIHLQPFIDEFRIQINQKHNALLQSDLAKFIIHLNSFIPKNMLNIEDGQYHYFAKELFFLEAEFKNEQLIITTLKHFSLHLPNPIKSLSFKPDHLIKVFQDWEKTTDPADNYFQSLLIKYAIEMENYNKERQTKAQEEAFREQSNKIMSELFNLTILMNKVSELDLTPKIKEFRENLTETQKRMNEHQAIVSELLKYPTKIVSNFKEWLEILEKLTHTVETSEEQLIIFQEHFKKVYKLKGSLIQKNVKLGNFNKAKKQLLSIHQIYVKSQTLINTINQARKELSNLNDKIEEANIKNCKTLQHAVKKTIKTSNSLAVENKEELWQAFERLEAQFKELQQKKDTLILQQESKKAILSIRRINLTKKPSLEVHSNKLISQGLFYTKKPKALTLDSLSDLPKRMVVNKEKALLKQLLQIEIVEVHPSLYCYALLGTIARLMEHYKNSQGLSPFSKEIAKNFRNAIFHYPDLIKKVSIEEVRDLSLQILSFIEDKKAWKAQLLEAIPSRLFALGIGKIENIPLTLDLCKEQLKQAQLELNLYPSHSIYSAVEQAALGFIYAKVSTYASALKRIDKDEYQLLNKEFNYKLNKYIQLGNQYRHEAFPSSTFMINNQFNKVADNSLSAFEYKSEEEEHKTNQHFI